MYFQNCFYQLKVLKLKLLFIIKGSEIILTYPKAVGWMAKTYSPKQVISSSIPTVYKKEGGGAPKGILP